MSPLCSTGPQELSWGLGPLAFTVVSDPPFHFGLSTPSPVPLALRAQSFTEAAQQEARVALTPLVS